MNIKVESIFPNTYQPRKFFNEEALNELSQSIIEHGIIQPITVRRMGDKFELVAGERRWRAARMAELEFVPCNVIDITDTESAELALLENLQREDLNFMEEAEAYYNLINDHKFTQEELAKRMGKKQSTIANKLRLLKLSDKVRILCLENNLTERHARALLSLPNEELQLKVVKKVNLKAMNSDIDITLELWKNKEAFRENFRSQDFFCFKHNKLLINSAKEKFSKKDYEVFKQEIINVQMKYCKELESDLEWFINKFDYRYANEPWYNAKDSIYRAREVLKKDSI